MKCIIEVKMDNAAFEGYALEELARILRSAARRLDRGIREPAIRDFNGNVVGTLDITE